MEYCHCFEWIFLFTSLKQKKEPTMGKAGRKKRKEAKALAKNQVEAPEGFNAKEVLYGVFERFCCLYYPFVAR